MQSLTSPVHPVKPSSKRPARHARISRPVNGNYAVMLQTGKACCFSWLEPIPADQGSAFLLIKWEEYREEGEPDSYHVNVNGLLSSCECRGFLRHGMCKDGKGCKHIAGLARLIAEGKLTPLPSKPASKAEVAACEAPVTSDFDQQGGSGCLRGPRHQRLRQLLRTAAHGQGGAHALPLAGDTSMNAKSIALALRTAAENQQRAKDLVKGLPARVVDDDSALALWLDAPKVIHALYNVAGTLDPEGTAEEDEQVGLLFDTSPARRVSQ